MRKLKPISEQERRKSVGLWLRVSTEEAASKGSPEIHEHRAREFAALRGWNVVEVYRLEGVSGESLIEHPETRRMLDDVRCKRINALVFSKLARLARNAKQLIEFAEIFKVHGADLVSIFEPIDTSTPGGRLFYIVLAALAQWEREEIVDRIRNSVEERAKMGKPLNGKATLGYFWLNKHLEINQSQAVVRRLILQLFAYYERLRTVAAKLNTAGFRTSNGCRFTCRSLRRLIRDKTPIGIRRSYYTTKKGLNSVALRPESAWRIIASKPIVPDSLWKFCNELLDARRTGRRPGRQPSHLFSGLVQCSCGSKMYVLYNTAKYVCQKCRTKVATTKLESLVVNHFFKGTAARSVLLLAPEFLSSRKDIETLHRSLVDDLAKTEKNLHVLSDLGAAKEVSPFGLEKRVNQLKLRRSQLMNTLAQIDSSGWLFNDSSSTLIAPRFSNENHMIEWQELDFTEKRKLVESLIKQVTITANGGICFQTFDHRSNQRNFVNCQK